ncbi:MAG: hypothetical protein HY590_01955 [Candidatus Omnitrophica bacterium]|nr:hypothetical protein [Candidatus Omnitrophota bacterium]
MWVYMMTCYIMTLFTFIFLITAFFQGIFKFTVFEASHVSFMILTAILYLFTETLVIFFFVGTGMGIKESVLDHKRDPQFHRRSIAIKRKVFPPIVLNILFMIILFVLVGAVDTHRFPIWAYHIIFLGCIVHFVKTKITQNQSFGDIMKIVLDMSEVKKE